jgi:hypothetical protein
MIAHGSIEDCGTRGDVAHIQDIGAALEFGRRRLIRDKQAAIAVCEASSRSDSRLTTA